MKLHVAREKSAPPPQDQSLSDVVNIAFSLARVTPVYIRDTREEGSGDRPISLTRLGLVPFPQNPGE